MCTGPAFISGITTFMTSYGSALEAHGQQVRAVRRHNKQLHRNFLMELQIVQRQDSIDHAIYQEQIKARDESEESYFLNKELNQLSASLADASNQLTFKERVQKGLFDMQTNMIKSLQAEGQLAASGVQPGASMGAILDDNMRQLGMAEAIIDESFESSKTALGITAYQSSMSQNSADQNNWNQINPGPSQQPFSGIQPYRPIYQEKPESPNAFQFIMQALFSAAMAGMMADAGGGLGGGPGVDAVGATAVTPPVNPFAGTGVVDAGIGDFLNPIDFGITPAFDYSAVVGNNAWTTGTGTAAFNTGAASILPQTVPIHHQSALAGMGGKRGLLAIRHSSPVLQGQSATQWGGLNTEWGFPGVQQNLGLTGSYTDLNPTTLGKVGPGGQLGRTNITVGDVPLDQLNLRPGQTPANVRLVQDGGRSYLEFPNRQVAEAHFGQAGDSLIEYNGRWGLHINRFQVADLQNYANQFSVNRGVNVFSGRPFYIHSSVNPGWF